METRTLWIRAERTSLLVAVMALLAVAWLARRGFGDPSLAYRFGAFTALSPALGSLIFLLVRRTTGGVWGDVLMPYFNAGAGLLPFLWLLVLAGDLFQSPAMPPWPSYDSRAMLLGRGLGMAVIFFWLSAAARRGARGGWVGPVGLIVLLFALHVVADDRIASLGPAFHSTAFPLVWMLNQAVAGIALAVLAATLAGCEWRQSVMGERPFGVDVGNLLMATMLLWCYVSFGQFLIVWSGDLPSEIAWFNRRVENGWTPWAVALVLIYFVVPFPLLLSRRLKQSAWGLGILAGCLILAQVVAQIWIFLPSGGAATWRTLLLPFGVMVFVGGAFLHRYLAMARRTEEIG